MVNAEFGTIKREQDAINPSKTGSAYPELHKLIAPHLDSFNAIKTTNGGRGKGLLEMGVADLARRDIRDSKGNHLQCIYGYFDMLVNFLSLDRECSHISAQDWRCQHKGSRQEIDASRGFF